MFGYLKVFYSNPEGDAARGATLLDSKNPGWFKNQFIDSKSIRMISCLDCVLGQLYGYYGTGINSLGIKSDLQASHFGFYPKPSFLTYLLSELSSWNLHKREENYRECIWEIAERLRDAWIREIEIRRMNSVSGVPATA